MLAIIQQVKPELFCLTHRWCKNVGKVTHRSRYNNLNTPPLVRIKSVDVILTKNFLRNTFRALQIQEEFEHFESSPKI